MNKLLSSIQYVADNSEHVTVNHDAINQYVSTFESVAINHWMKACPFEYRPCARVEDEIDRWFLADAMAYCFWGYPTKWTINYEGKMIDGWWALLASMQRAIELGVPLLSGSYLAGFNHACGVELFAGEPQIPLLSERIQDFNQIGQQLIKNYSGHFHNYLTECPSDATEFIIDLASKFPTFQDVSNYKGQTIFFYKKAQLLVHDLSTAFSDSVYVKLTGLDRLTGEADYKVPATLRNLGILIYSKELADKVDQKLIITPNSSEEVEIRAGMLWACHLIVQKLRPKYPDMNALTLDGILWVASQTKSPSDKPYHLTLTRGY